MGATYHLMGRGIRKQAIYYDEEDYRVFLQILAKALKKKSCKLHAYCLMTNHFHLLLKTNEVNVGEVMKFVTCNYAKYFNEKYHYRGHLFEGRYRGCLVKTDGYFLHTSRYIHLNPVKAKIVQNPEDYPWSSFTTMVGIEDDKMTTASDTLNYFGKDGIREYRKFVEGVDAEKSEKENEIRQSMRENELWLPD